jgi:hypothetical protein
MGTKRKETHLGTAGSMDHPQLFADTTASEKASDNLLNEKGPSGEHRDYDTIPEAVQSPSDVFHQEASGDAHRMITAETAGVTVTFEPVGYEEGQPSTPSNPNNQFRRKREK